MERDILLEQNPGMQEFVSILEKDYGDNPCELIIQLKYRLSVDDMLQKNPNLLLAVEGFDSTAKPSEILEALNKKQKSENEESK